MNDPIARIGSGNICMKEPVVGVGTVLLNQLCRTARCAIPLRLGQDQPISMCIRSRMRQLRIRVSYLAKNRCFGLLPNLTLSATRMYNGWFTAGSCRVASMVDLPLSCTTSLRGGYNNAIGVYPQEGWLGTKQ